MPIPKKIRSRDLAGKEIVTAERMVRPALVDIPAGSRFHVATVTTGFNLKSPEPCPCCGLWIQTENVPRDRAFLPDDPAAPRLETLAFWKNRAEYNDHLWAECSNCGFQVENYKAVETGRSSDDYTEPKYKFCPKCGKRMAVRDWKGDVVT